MNLLLIRGGQKIVLYATNIIIILCYFKVSHFTCEYMEIKKKQVALSRS